MPRTIDDVADLIVANLRRARSTVPVVITAQASNLCTIRINGTKLTALYPLPYSAKVPGVALAERLASGQWVVVASNFQGDLPPDTDQGFEFVYDGGIQVTDGGQPVTEGFSG